MRRMFLITPILFAFAAGLTLARETAPFRAGTQDGAKKPAGQPEDRKKIVEDVKADLTRAVIELQRDNAGAETRAAQKRIIDNLNKLLESDDDPPSSPPPQSSDSQKPMTPPPSSAQEPKPQPSEAKPQPRPTAPEEKPGEIKSSSVRPASTPEGTNEKNPGSAAEMLKEMAKQQGYWPNLPPRLPPQMDVHSRDRFPRRYEDLLREYYRAIAESNRRGVDE